MCVPARTQSMGWALGDLHQTPVSTPAGRQLCTGRGAGGVCCAAQSGGDSHCREWVPEQAWGRGSRGPTSHCSEPAGRRPQQSWMPGPVGARVGNCPWPLNPSLARPDSVMRSWPRLPKQVFQAARKSRRQALPQRMDSSLLPRKNGSHTPRSVPSWPFPLLAVDRVSPSPPSRELVADWPVLGLGTAAPEG